MQLAIKLAYFGGSKFTVEDIWTNRGWMVTFWGKLSLLAVVLPPFRQCQYLESACYSNQCSVLVRAVSLSYNFLSNAADCRLQLNKSSCNWQHQVNTYDWIFYLYSCFFFFKFTWFNWVAFCSFDSNYDCTLYCCVFVFCIFVYRSFMMRCSAVGLHFNGSALIPIKIGIGRNAKWWMPCSLEGW